MPATRKFTVNLTEAADDDLKAEAERRMIPPAMLARIFIVEGLQRAKPETLTRQDVGFGASVSPAKP